MNQNTSIYIYIYCRGPRRALCKCPMGTDPCCIWRLRKAEYLVSVLFSSSAFELQTLLRLGGTMGFPDRAVQRPLRYCPGRVALFCFRGGRVPIELVCGPIGTGHCLRAARRSGGHCVPCCYRCVYCITVYITIF